jgi:hypothetical protein
MDLFAQRVAKRSREDANAKWVKLRKRGGQQQCGDASLSATIDPQTINLKLNGLAHYHREAGLFI